MLSKSCEYALRAIVYISCNASVEHKLGFKEVAEKLDIPSAYMGKILQKLTKNGVIKGVKGPNGGFYLRESCKETKLIRVVEVIDGLDYFTKCGLGLHECSETRPCPVHNELKVFRDGVAAVFAKKSINDMVQSIQAGEAFIQNVAP